MMLILITSVKCFQLLWKRPTGLRDGHTIKGIYCIGGIALTMLNFLSPDVVGTESFISHHYN